MCLHQPYYFLLLNCDQIEKKVVVAKADETGHWDPWQVTPRQ